MEMRTAHNIQTEKTFYLAGSNQQCRASGKAYHHGVRNKINQHSHTGQTKDELEQTGQEGEC